MTRRPIAMAVIAALASLILGDFAAGHVPDPYRAPPLIALGSGAAVSGAHCSALPSQ